MNTLTIILICIAGLIALLLIVALFVKKEYFLSREIIINKPKEEVFSYIKYLKNQDNYSKWAMMDPAMKKEYKGTDGTVGFVSAWDSKNKNVGKGEQEIKNIAEGERVNYEIRFIKPMHGVAQSFISTESMGSNQTFVKWGFESAMKYPVNIMLLFMNMDKLLGNDLQEGLNNLQALLEKE